VIMDPRLAKQVLRQQMLDRWNAVPPREIERDSESLCEQLRGQRVWHEARIILAFHPMPGEADLRPLLAAAASLGKTLALPRWNPARRCYEAVQLGEFSDLAPGHFGILEPPPDSPIIELMMLDLVLVPGLAYDPKGRRLGRGKGYFDRILEPVRGHKCGVAFAWQVLAEVPTEPHDVCVNSLLTPARWMPCGI
jgi:5-formyltetrahydrofolate cyclo-ligase